MPASQTTYLADITWFVAFRDCPLLKLTLSKALIQPSLSFTGGPYLGAGASISRLIICLKVGSTSLALLDLVTSAESMAALLVERAYAP